MANPRSTASIAGHPIHPMLVPFRLPSSSPHSSATSSIGKPPTKDGRPAQHSKHSHKNEGADLLSRRLSIA
jgi:hypothetical protein